MKSARAPRAVSHWLLRVLLPSWRFFEAEEEELVLEVRTQRGGEPPAPFVRAVPAAQRGAFGLVFAPRHNLRLACYDLIERWVQELAERGALAQTELEALASYARVRQMARYFLRETTPEPARVRYQLRLSARGAGAPSEALFTSPYYPLA